jgi:hypothetical protein
MRALYAVVALFLAAGAVAQRPLFDPDDAVDPRHREGTLFISRLIVGGGADLADHYRPLQQNVGFISIANALYWSNFQFDYKHSEARGEENGPRIVHSCDCDGLLYFPTPPSSHSIPDAPLPGSKDVVQFAWYDRSSAAALRYRVTWSHQAIDTEVRSAAGGQLVSRHSGDEQSLGLEADTLIRIRGHRHFGLITLARTVRNGTPDDDRSQTELTYMSRFPAVSVGRLLLRCTLTVGGVSNRGGTALNVVNPAVEGYWQERVTGVNLHLIYSPQVMNSGTEGWKTNHQIAFFVDRALFAKLFRGAASTR